MMGGTRLSISLAAPFRATSTRGMILLAAVVALSTKLLISCPKLALSSATPVTRFAHAAFAALKLPEIVVDASFAVVPVMSYSV